MNEETPKVYYATHWRRGKLTTACLATSLAVVEAWAIGKGPRIYHTDPTRPPRVGVLILEHPGGWSTPAVVDAIRYLTERRIPTYSGIGKRFVPPPPPN